MLPGASRELVRNGWNGFLELVYPSWCEGCGQWGAPPVCDACIGGFEAFGPHSCDICPTLCGTEPCPACVAADREWGGWAFERALAVHSYTGTLRHLIHVFKYRGVSSLGPLLGSLMAQAVLEQLPARSWDVVLPVPGEPGRTRQRGYNPARLLAQPIAAARSFPLMSEDAVVRTRRSRSQMGLSAEQRRCAGDRFGFSVQEPAEIAGRSVLIVDDVFTTGSTVQALARAIKSAGAGSIEILCLAAGR